MSNFLTVKQIVKNSVKDAEGNDQEIEAELTFTIPYANVSFTVADEGNNVVRAVMKDGTTHILDGSSFVTFSEEYKEYLNRQS
jgi:hypothetical protein